MADRSSDLGRIMKAFFQTFPDFEDLEKLPDATVHRKEKADYLFSKRAVIAEQKDLMEFEFKLTPEFFSFERSMIKKYGPQQDLGRIEPRRLESG